MIYHVARGRANGRFKVELSTRDAVHAETYANLIASEEANGLGISLREFGKLSIRSKSTEGSIFILIEPTE